MKSRTLFFDTAVFKKNLTRFAPVWGLYTLCLLLGLMLMADSGLAYWFPENLGQCIRVMPVINCGYALVVAQLVFGDLFNTRMCNALHALPIRRETWFGTNVLTGLTFSAAPSLVMTLVALPLMAISELAHGWQLPLLWLLGTNLQFLFFFAAAVLCVFCAGSRFAQAVLYGIVNLGSLAIYWLADTIYIPMLYGIQTRYNAFLPFFPLGQMAESSYVELEYRFDAYRRSAVPCGFMLTERWGWLWLYAGVGLVLLVLALLLYRRRRLETAGDFIAVKPLEPVFLVLYSLMAATLLQMFDELFFANRGYFLLVIGLVVGFFTGKMLLERRVNVFHKKNWVAIGVLAVVVAGSLVLTSLDPLGVTRWVPKAENVERVELSMGYNYGVQKASVVLEDTEDIENILFVHRAALEDRIGENERGYLIIEPVDVNEKGIYSYPVTITIRYRMKNGSVSSRYYRIWSHEEEGQLVKNWLSRLECVTGTDDLAGMQGDYISLVVNGLQMPYEYLEGGKFRSLLEAVEADCAQGNMAQKWAYHQEEYIYISENSSISSLYLELCIGDFVTYFDVYGDSENVMAWLEENGVLDYALFNEKYQ